MECKYEVWAMSPSSGYQDGVHLFHGRLGNGIPLDVLLPNIFCPFLWLEWTWSRQIGHSDFERQPREPELLHDREWDRNHYSVCASGFTSWLTTPRKTRRGWASCSLWSRRRFLIGQFHGTWLFAVRKGGSKIQHCLSCRTYTVLQKVDPKDTVGFACASSLKSK